MNSIFKSRSYILWLIIAPLYANPSFDESNLDDSRSERVRLIPWRIGNIYIYIYILMMINLYYNICIIFSFSVTAQ